MGDGVEIERRFLVAQMPDLAEARRETVRQGYLTRPGESAQVRLRRKGDSHVITVKSGSGVERAEHETEITRGQFDALWPATDARRLSKTRWTGQLPDGSSFELDVFDPPLAPLCLVEVEFSDRDAAARFRPPDWFGREVTEDAAYTNARLAAEGAPGA